MRKKIISFLLSLLMVFNSFMPIAYAETYKQSKNSHFYALENGKSIEEIFTFKLKDALEGKKALDWGKTFNSFTVLRELPSGEFNIFPNIPNLQLLAKNTALGEMQDGYTDETYKVEDTQRFINVGSNADKINAITKYGFKIKSPRYYGEYPKALISTNGIIPDNFFARSFKVVASIFGASFIDAPSGEDFKTISYYNHDYKANDEKVIKFIQDYWMQYFVAGLDKSNYKNAEEFKNAYVSSEDESTADNTLNAVTCEVGPKLPEAKADFNQEAKGKECYDMITNIEKKWNDGNYKYQTAEQAAGLTDGLSPNKQYVSDMALYVKGGKEGKEPDFKEYKVNYEDVISPEMQLVKKEYENAQGIKQKADDFKKKTDSWSSKDDKVIKLNQCLIESDESKKCSSSKKSGEPVTLAVANVYYFSDASKITEEIKSNGSISRENAAKILLAIKSYSGPYYSEVMSNIITVMKKRAIALGKKIDTDNNEYARFMPFELQTLIPNDKKSYHTADPRAEIFKSFYPGAVFANFDVKNVSTVISFFAFQPQIVDLAGRISELTVLNESLCNFDVLVEHKISPIDMWNSGIATIIMNCLVILALITIGTKAWQFMRESNKSVVFSVFISILLLTFELGTLFLIYTKPKQIWDNLRKPIEYTLDLGSKVSPLKYNKNLSFLFQDNSDDEEIMMYLPYLDAWSIYNTGHSLTDECQSVDLKSRVAKDMVLPKINNTPIQNWAIVLLDSFTYSGDSQSISGAMQGDKLINGKVINNNAYRAVDNYLAPKFETKKIGNDKVELSVTENPNYNGKFQSGYLLLLAKVSTIIFVWILSIAKLLTFAWVFIQLYLLLFKILQDRLINKSMLDTFLDFLYPILGCTMISLFTNFIILASMELDNALMIILFNIIMLIGFTKVANDFVNTSHGPKSLGLLLFLLNIPAALRKRNHIKNYDVVRNAQKAHFDLKEEDLQDIESYREKLFTENNKIKSAQPNLQVLKDYVKRVDDIQEIGNQKLSYDVLASYETAKKYIEEFDDKQEIKEKPKVQEKKKQEKVEKLPKITFEDEE